MVKKIKRIKKRPKVVRGGSNQWLVPFDEGGKQPFTSISMAMAMTIAPVGPSSCAVTEAVKPYQAHAPDLHTTVNSYREQDGRHLCSWFDSGVQAMYFVLCDHDNPDGGYQFGLPADEARELLQGRVPHSHYRRESQRF